MVGIRASESRISRMRRSSAWNCSDRVSSPVLSAFRSLTQASGFSPVTSSSHWIGVVGLVAGA